MICGQGLMMPFSGFLLTKLGLRLTTLLGGWIMSAGMLLSYLTIQSSFYVLAITYGFMFGAGVGIAYVPPLVCSMKWLPEKKGLANGFVVAGFGGGAFIFNQVQTAYINPNNIAPNISLPKHPDEKYFDDPEVLDNVPSSFLILGATYAVMQLIGVLLLFEPQEQSRDKIQKNSPSSEKEKLLNANNEDEDGHVDPSIETTLDPKGSGLNLRPTEIVKTRAFWILWWTFFLNSLGPIFVSALYKAFGQTFISDDNFLALVGAFSAVGNAGGRIFWGILADMFSYKTAMLFLCSTFTVFILTIMAAPYGGKPMFFIWIFMIFFIFSGSFSLFPTATARAFGSEHVGINYGLVFSSNIISGPIGALLPIVLQDTLGWNGMFGLLSGFSVIGFILTVMFNVKRPTGENI
ncbi:apicoplast pyruvate carrier 1-like isoform X2 [Amphiura filiformis]